MQVPEKLSLIGGSILLASTLVFTLKSQASNILPKVDRGMSSLVHADKSGQSSNDSSQSQQPDQQKQQEQAFDNNFQQAQQKGWQTGQWGTAQFYVDDQDNMHVGNGQLSGSYSKLVDVNKINAISLEGQIEAPQDSSYLFSNGESDPEDNSNDTLKSINNLNRLDTSQTTNMSYIFAYNHSLQSLDVSHFNTSHVTNMLEMFDANKSIPNLDVSGFDTSHVTNMNHMFHNNQTLKQLNVNNFDTSNVTDMSEMFSMDADLTNLDLSHFDTSHVTNMDSMFDEEGSSLQSIDVSHFNTSKVNNMAYMFNRDDSLSNLDVSHFDTSHVSDMKDMFESDGSLSNLDLSHFDTHNVNYMDEMLYSDNIHQLSLGPNTTLQNGTYLSGTYQNNGQTLNLDGNAHPGTWIRQ